MATPAPTGSPRKIPRNSIAQILIDCTDPAYKRYAFAVRGRGVGGQLKVYETPWEAFLSNTWPSLGPPTPSVPPSLPPTRRATDPPRKTPPPHFGRAIRQEPGQVGLQIFTSRFRPRQIEMLAQDART
jgi:hypothetical protein